ncbi:MAG: hypothetical protein GY851_22315 [bacterium]|nr:hypothetical protein [bacterium]
MEHLRSIGTRIWLNKEKLVLVILLVALVYQGHTIFYPEERADLPNAVSPKPPRFNEANSEEYIGQIMDELEIPTISLPPEPFAPVPVSGLTGANPFSVHGSTLGGAPREEARETVETPQVVVERIQPAADGSVRAWIKVGERRARPRTVGAEFDGYTLDSIDAEGQSVVVTSKADGRQYSYRVEGAS